ncbi:hypothetical protein GYMLUDRAFT_43987 [Collybiopsis luxurians FD-317 M1]|uniref:Unplaced genomic scaffold GYMLUscaffold_29, whole genome shotgun sequence n=1 Tax=Collybiopsis luxurians FD-317 M1 TaxID=944289 RepID=A0A0D0BWF1_9AGAR|nr:hypothetical protein GYMLUDRAFT_43987 [Collybiopsis luxurians FD-317 M1]
MSNLEAPAQASASAMPQGVTDPNYKPLPGCLGNLTVPQQHALDNFRKELQEEGFLRARKFDVALAKTMIIDCEKCRKEFGVDDIVKNFDFPEKEEVDKYYLQFYHKMDKVYGCPIYIEQLGKLDFKALYACTTQDRLLKHLVWEYEKFITSRLPACSAAVGHPVETSCTILDLKDVSLSNFYHVKDYIMAASSIGQNRYPECMGKFYIINAPWLFSGVWTVIKPWLDKVTVAKIAILGKDYKDTLLAQIPKENLLKELGGGCTCGKGC